VQPETRTITQIERGGALVSPTATIDSFKLLDVFAGGISDEAPRVEALATISAGYRGKGEGNRPGLPQRSKDGEIFLHDATNRAPGLKRALAQFGNKKLTIAFPFDDPAQFIHCRFMSYSATELLAYGDDTHLMVLVPGKGYQRVEVGTEAYAAWVGKCKVSVSVYFCLADWGDDGPEIAFPDGVGAYYRLRFTSRHSLRSILAGLRSIAQFTHGRIAGVPFDLAIDYREVADATGKKRTIPVWTIATKPPGGRRLTSRNFSETMQFALEQGAALMLPAPPEPTFEEALAERPDDDLDETIVEGVVVGEVSDRELELIQAGGRCDEARWRAMFFSAVRGTEFDGDDSPARAAWLREYTKGQTDSLSDFLHWSTEKEAQAMVVAASDELNRRRVARTERGEAPPARTTAKPRRTFEELFGKDDDAPPATPAASEVAAEPAQAASGPLTLPDEPDWARADERPVMLAAWDAWAAVLRRLDPAYEIKDPSRLNAQRLVAELRGVVGYARETYDQVYGGRDDEDDDEIVSEPAGEATEALEQVPF
jgi:hypothetical protein